MTYKNGKYPETIALLNEAGNLLNQIHQNSYSGRVFSRLARLYQELGQFEKAVECFDRSIALFKKVEGHPLEKSLLFKSRSQLKRKLGDSSEINDLFIALDYVNKAENPLELGKIYFLLIEFGYNTGDLEIAEKYFSLLENLCLLPECNSLVPYLEYAKVLKYRSHERLIPLASAMKLLSKLNETENLPFKLKILVNYSMLELYFSELMIFFNEEVLKDINRSFSTLLQSAKSFPSKLFEIRLLILKARFSIIVHDSAMAEELISAAEERAKRWNIPSFIELVEKERADLLQKAKASELFLKTFKDSNISEELRGSDLKEYLEKVKKVIQTYGT